MMARARARIVTSSLTIIRPPVADPDVSGDSIFDVRVWQLADLMRWFAGGKIALTHCVWNVDT